VGRVSRPERLVALVKELFEANRTIGSQVTTGDLRPGRTQWVYARGGHPCRRCGTIIRVRGPREPERVTYWCPSCQPPASARRRRRSWHRSRPTRYPVCREPPGALGDDPLPVDGVLRSLARLGLRRLRRIAVQLRRPGLRAP